MRLTKHYLTARFTRCAEAMGWDHTGPRWARNADDRNVSKVGHVSLEKSFYGWSVVQIVNEQGGQRQLTGFGSIKAAELDAWMSGLLFAKGVA